MLVGVNVTSGPSANFARQAVDRAAVGFTELLLDNFLHLDPDDVAQQVPGPVTFHIMWSRFAHRSEADLVELAAVVRRWIDRLQPLYVSDHLLAHECDGVLLPEPVEVDYDDDRVVAAAGRWQDMLDVPLLLENAASAVGHQQDQIDMFLELQRRHDIHVLFDVSNAVVSELNGTQSATRWMTSALRLEHCHISGYRRLDTDPPLYVDSHDAPVSARSWAILAALISTQGAPRTLVVERDGEVDTKEWHADIEQSARLVSA